MGWGGVPAVQSYRALTRPTLGPARGRKISGALLTLGCVLLMNCGGQSRLVAPTASPPAANAETAPTPLSAPTNTFAAPQIGEIIWTASTDPTTNAPIEPVARYSSDAPRIIAAVPARTLTAGSRVEANWKYNNTSLDAFTILLVPPENVGETWINVHIDRDPEVPWPEGVYEVTISLDGAAMQHAAVEVTGRA